MSVVALCFLFLFAATNAVVVPDEDWGYVQVRPGAEMFWWLYGQSNNSTRSAAPLVIWLQGGPGASSTGFGNFMEIGPLDVNLKPRAVNWVQKANVIFVDNPVGTGYSYVTDDNAYATTDKQIGLDLVAMLKGFLTKYPNLQNNPFFIFSESYGGKMATSFGVELTKAINSKQISVNFRGVALGDSWVSPISFVNTWADYLLVTSEIDDIGHKQISAAVDKCVDAVNNKEWVKATNEWGNVENVVGQWSANVNWYNILDRQSEDDESQKRLFNFETDPLTALMNGPIRQKLGATIPSSVTWGGQSDEVFTQLSGAFMQPIVDGVDFLLASGVNVAVYSGNLDLICCTTGTTEWMKQLKWQYMSHFWTAERQSWSNEEGIVVGFKRDFKNLRFYNILAAGHMVTADQPIAGQILLEDIVHAWTD